MLRIAFGAGSGEPPSGVAIVAGSETPCLRKRSANRLARDYSERHAIQWIAFIQESIMSTLLHSEHSNLQQTSKLSSEQALALSSRQLPVSLALGAIFLSVLGIGI